MSKLPGKKEPVVFLGNLTVAYAPYSPKRHIYLEDCEDLMIAFRCILFFLVEDIRVSWLMLFLSIPRQCPDM